MLSTERRLQTKRGSRSLEGGRVDSRHPNSRLVDFEEVGDEGVEVDVAVGEVVEGELLAVPGDLSVCDDGKVKGQGACEGQ